MLYLRFVRITIDTIGHARGVKHKCHTVWHSQTHFRKIEKLPDKGDIDFFKKINDTYGHDCGDVALTEVAEILRTCVRDGDTVCRWGGEEFLIAIDGNKKITMDVAERIRSMIEDMVVVSHGYSIKITMTFGVCESIPGLNVDKLVEIADQRLYKGKQNGKNQVVSE